MGGQCGRGGWVSFSVVEKNKPETEEGQIWLVLYECRIAAITVANGNKGFFAAGQDGLWGFDNVVSWIKCLYDPRVEEAAILHLLESTPTKRVQAGLPPS
jgi:hypothetical protein